MAMQALLLSSFLLGLALHPGTPDDHDKAAKLVADVTACRAIADSGERLQCYDRSAAALAEASESRRIIVADREDVLRLRRPSPLAGPDGVEADQISGTVSAIGRIGDGRVTFTLDSGSSWTQSDYVPVPGKLKPGGKVTVRRGALGSYVGTLQGRPGFKVKPNNY